MDAATIEKTKAEHPNVEILHLTAKDGSEVLAKIPQKKEMDMFRDLASSDKTKSRSPERLLRACVLHPVQEELGMLLDRRPGLVESWVGKLLEAAGITEEAEAKKL